VTARDVSVVGAGLIGMGIAYELAKHGATVTVYDRAEPGRAASWAGAGMLAPYSERLDDAPLRTLCEASLHAYPAFVAELHERTGVDAKLTLRGSLHVVYDDRPPDGLPADAERLDRHAAHAHEPMLGRDVRGAVLVGGEGAVDNRRLSRALFAACAQLGVRFERAGEIALACDARRVRGIRSERGFVASGAVVNAAGAWAGVLEGTPATARVAVRPVAGEMLALAVPAGFAQRVVWCGDGIYLVPRDDGRLLVGATVLERGFDVRVTAAGVARLLGGALRAVPALAGFALVETWAGLRPASHDGRPYIGATAIDGYLVAAGHYRNGILLAPVTAQAIAAVLADVPAPVDLAAFDPRRAAPEAA
jgi:glycine oxidase